MPFDGYQKALTPSRTDSFVYTFPPRQSFEAWLSEKPPEEIVAVNWDSSSCPLAGWLTEHHKWRDTGVYAGGFYVVFLSEAQENVGGDLPGWALKFVKEVDYHKYCRSRNGTHKGASAAHCLHILNTIRDD